jgi:hypothetical protein
MFYSFLECGMKKQLLIAAVAATMYVSAMADIKISGTAKVTFTTYTSSSTSFTTNTESSDELIADITVTTIMNEDTVLRNMYYSDKSKRSEDKVFGEVSTPENFVDKFDLNKDDKVTKEELEENANNRFSKLNKDGVGDITKEDLTSSLKNKLTADFTKMFSELDENKDGLITSAEDFNFTNALTNNEGDINKDGRASLAEYTAFSIKTTVQDAIEWIDSNNDQKISEEEFLAKIIEVMNEFDTDNNKIVNSSE